ncbi:hypothetical protein [Lichenibacterium ramalinae]|uniref:Uncharacterized protein n=1 Tax=Lichenibacterium ramalinae TaxID=2316527 RepID=A0A4Q2R723_9HYPH|nr:hypothetical protein [Lichenibacterium ramalinae]RYB01513.1 hypothetical protein D3272_25835 [Lichenibacterium ramalinae]
MSTAFDLLQARTAFVTLARPSVAYCKALGLDWNEVEAAAGGVYMAPIRTSGDFFGFDPQGIEAAVIEVRATDAWTVQDLVAWYPTAPDQWFVAVGGVPALGMAHATNPASYFGRMPLELYQSPAEWLQANCHGAVLLDTVAGVEWLYELPQPLTIAVRDDAHAREIDAARRQLGFGRRHALVVPADSRVAA